MRVLQLRTEWSEASALWSSGVYEYDGAGNIKAVGNDVYRYDGAGRLIYAGANTDRTNTQEYTYDIQGNVTEITTTTGSSVEIRQFAVDPKTNRLTQQPCKLPDVTCFHGTYDEAGNQLDSVSGDTLRGTSSV